MYDKNSPIGVFDSGIGGLTVLKEAVKLLPNEDFIYYGDSKNAPYGTKSVEDIKKLVNNIVKFLLNKKVKAILVACNTATSVAIHDLRQKYDIPVIGIEPALKPAVEYHKSGKIIIMGTPVTIKEDKFNNLMQEFNNEDIMPMPCDGLAELIERHDIQSNEIKQYLQNKFVSVDTSQIETIVLGCTHYPFVKRQIADIVGENVNIIDGSIGTSKQLKRMLEKNNILNDSSKKGVVSIYNSLDTHEVIDLCYKLLKD